MSSNIAQWLALGITILAGLISLAVSDARSKARGEYVDEKIVGINTLIAEGFLRVGVLETKMATSEQDRLDLHRGEKRLDETKASRDVVDGIKQDIQVLRNELSNRFDRVERLIEKSSVVN